MPAFSSVYGVRLLYGIGEPLIWNHEFDAEYQNLTKYGSYVDEYFKYAAAAGVALHREWTSIHHVLNPDKMIAKKYQGRLNRILKSAKAHNIGVIGFSAGFPEWMTGLKNQPENSIPVRSEDEGSPYQKMLKVWKSKWKQLAALYKGRIDYWEIGNEYNHDPFIRYAESYIPTEEKAKIFLDLLYFGREGILEANPSAKIIMGGLAPARTIVGQEDKGTQPSDLTSIRDFLEIMYLEIESGEYPCGEIKSTTVDHYFDFACWHPYIIPQPPTIDSFVKPNQMIFDVIEKHDPGRLVVFSEFGYTDTTTGLAPETIAAFLVNSFELARNNLSDKLVTMFWFRMLNGKPSGILNAAEEGFGIRETIAQAKPAYEAYRGVAHPAYRYHGRNVQVSGTSAIFFVWNGKKRGYPSPEIYWSHSGDTSFSQITEIFQDELDFLEDDQAMAMAGTYERKNVKLGDGIYYVIGGRRYLYPNYDVFLKHNPASLASNYVEISQDDLQAIPDGGVME